MCIRVSQITLPFYMLESSGWLSDLAQIRRYSLSQADFFFVLHFVLRKVNQSFTFSKSKVKGLVLYRTALTGSNVRGTL